MGCDGPLHSRGGADGSWGVMGLLTHSVEPMALRYSNYSFFGSATAPLPLFLWVLIVFCVVWLFSFVLPVHAGQVQYTMQKNGVAKGVPPDNAAAGADGIGKVPLCTHAKHPVLYSEVLNIFNATTMMHLTPDPNCVLTCIRRKVTSVVLCRSSAHVSALMNWLLEKVASQMTTDNVLSPAPSQSDLGRRLRHRMRSPSSRRRSRRPLKLRTRRRLTRKRRKTRRRRRRRMTMMMRRRRRQKARHLQQSLRTRPVWLFCACSGSAVTCKHSF